MSPEYSYKLEEEEIYLSIELTVILSETYNAGIWTVCSLLKMNIFDFCQDCCAGGQHAGDYYQYIVLCTC